MTTYDQGDVVLVDIAFSEWSLEANVVPPLERKRMPDIDWRNWDRRHERMEWDIRREGRRWSREEIDTHYRMTPEKIELMDGMLFGTEADRIMMLGLLLENLGVDKAVQLGDPAVWRAAIAERDTSR